MDRDYNLSIVPTDISMPETQSSDDYWVQQILKKTHYSNSYDNEGGIHCIMAGMNSNPLSPQTVWRRSYYSCLLYTSPSPRDQRGSRMPSSA